jgi:hypothetical protein
MKIHPVEVKMIRVERWPDRHALYVSVNMSTIQCGHFLIIPMRISVMGNKHILTAELHYHPMHLISSVLICISEKSGKKKDSENHT